MFFKLIGKIYVSEITNVFFDFHYVALYACVTSLWVTIQNNIDPISLVYWFNSELNGNWPLPGDGYSLEGFNLNESFVFGINIFSEEIFDFTDS